MRAADPIPSTRIVSFVEDPQQPWIIWARLDSGLDLGIPYEDLANAPRYTLGPGGRVSMRLFDWAHVLLGFTAPITMARACAEAQLLNGGC